MWAKRPSIRTAKNRFPVSRLLSSWAVRSSNDSTRSMANSRSGWNSVTTANGTLASSGFAHAAVAKHLVEVTVERQHLSVETVEGAETEGAVSLQLANGDHAAIDAFHQRGRCGDLKQRRMVDLQGVGQRGHDDVRYRLAGLPASCF